MANLKSDQPLFSDAQLDQLRTVVREEVRTAIEDEVDPKFTAIQQDLIALKAGQERIEGILEDQAEVIGADGRIQRQLDNHDDRLKVLEKQPV